MIIQVVLLSSFYWVKGSSVRQSDSVKSSVEPIMHQNDSQLEHNISNVLDTTMLNYDKRIRPSLTKPVAVGVSIWVSSVSHISEVDMDFTLDMYFRQTWQDPRLQFLASSGMEELSLSEDMLAKIWWPDTFFANAKRAQFHTATTKNAFLRIRNDGTILHSLRLTVTASCPMDLTYFPMDTQTCTLEIESFGYTTRDITYYWNGGDNAVGIDDGVQLPQFNVAGKWQVNRLISLSTGNYSRLTVYFLFRRNMGYYLIQIYIPSSLIVILSWVSFWLNRSATPARVGLGITTVLTMTTFVSTTNASLPKISYMKSIDVFLITCFFMVFSALLEYAVVSFVSNASISADQHVCCTRRDDEGCRRACDSCCINSPLEKYYERCPCMSDAQRRSDVRFNEAPTRARGARDSPVKECTCNETVTQMLSCSFATCRSAKNLPCSASQTQKNHCCVSIESSPRRVADQDLMLRERMTDRNYVAAMANESPVQIATPITFRARAGHGDMASTRCKCERYKNSISHAYELPKAKTRPERKCTCNGDMNTISARQTSEIPSATPLSTTGLEESDYRLHQWSLIQSTVVDMDKNELARCGKSKMRWWRRFLQRHAATLPSTVDEYSRFCFPLVFACFQFLYWIIYMNISQ